MRCPSAPVTNHHHGHGHGHGHHRRHCDSNCQLFITTWLKNYLGQLPIHLHDASPVHVVGWKYHTQSCRWLQTKYSIELRLIV